LIGVSSMSSDGATEHLRSSQEGRAQRLLRIYQASGFVERRLSLGTHGSSIRRLIVQTALAQLDVHMSERTIEGIWDRHKHPRTRSRARSSSRRDISVWN